MRAILYIDCKGVKVDDIPVICEEIRRTDDLVMAKIYGAAERLEEYRVAAKGVYIQNCLYDEYTCAGVALAVDVMADVMTGKVEKVCIAASDSEFIPLVDKLKLTDTETVVIGSCNADRRFVEHAPRYTYIEALKGEKNTVAIPSANDIAEHIYSVSSYYNGIGANASMNQVYKNLIRKYPDFDVRNYGFTHLSTFVKKNVTGVEITAGENGDTYIKIIDDRKSIDEFAYSYVAEKGYTLDDMSELIDALKNKFPGFAMENYGYHTDYGFILSFNRFEIWENKGIKMKRSFKLSSKTDEESDVV